MTASSPDPTRNPVEATSTSEGCDGCIWSKRIWGRPITARCAHPTAVPVNAQLEQNWEAAVGTQIRLSQSSYK